ncbi:MAG: type II/IV secretion system protein, partial [Candidatus Tectomicrobia bacterium]|nr:type II/IV secretion system protein [Candidatus Tectomicrobia bacterium]
MEHLCEILSRAMLVTKAQASSILSEEKALKRKIGRVRGEDGNLPKRDGNGSPDSAPPALTAVDVVSSLGLPLAHNPAEHLTEEVIMRAVSEAAGIPFQRIDPLELDLEVVTSTIPRAFALKHLVVPLILEEGTLKVAINNPFDLELQESIRQVTGFRVAPVVSLKSDILKTIRQFYGFQSSVMAARKEIVAPLVDLGNLEQYVRVKSESEIESTDQHIRSAVDHLFTYAIENRASDIHLEPKRERALVRFRIDGVLHDIHSLPKEVYPAIISRIKMLARLDIAEKRRPQDGRIKLQYAEGDRELRVSTLPVAFGEKAVMRVLDPRILFQELGEMGFSTRDLALYRTFLARPHGMILVTGPTGSGKTTTLYSSLRSVATPAMNVTTIEDPIEMVFEEFNQVAVQSQVGITFASSLRSILRQDPDIIMVGEIRDQETADNAVQAALTGHLVLSTLHTNDAASAVTRLVDLGLEPFLLSSTIIGVVAQRLVRKICPHCSRSEKLKGQELAFLGLEPDAVEMGVFRVGDGCPKCRSTGYLGRTGVFEVLEVSEEISR